MPIKTLLCLGFGYTAQVLAGRLLAEGWRVLATSRGTEKAKIFPAIQFVTLEALPADITHILASAPPSVDGDPFINALPTLSQLEWVGYLSATSVYGDYQGAWVSEESATHPTSARGRYRLLAEEQWLRSGLPVHIFRLAGLYGVGRSVLDDLRAGTAKRIHKEGQVFSRVHIADVATVLMASIAKPKAGTIYNVADDYPCPAAEVIAYGAELLGVLPPPLIPLHNADLSPMAQSFYADNRRISNARIKYALGVELAYPTYREGLQALL